MARLSDAEESSALEAAWLEVQPDTARRILVAGVMAFAAKGYHGTTTRDIAERAGLSPAGLYVHFSSKEELLYRILISATRGSLQAVRAALASAPKDPMSRLKAAVRTVTLQSARYHTTGRIIEYELGSLDDGHRAEVAALRREIESMVREIVQDGVAAGDFEVPDIPGTTTAILSLAVDVARWYRSSGPRSPEEMGDLYADLAGRMVRRAQPAPDARPARG